MLNNAFEKQVESAMLFIAQEQIPDTPHRFPADFEARLMQQTADTGIGQTHTKTVQPQPIRVHKSKSAAPVSRLLTWGSLAAGFMAAITVGAVMLHEQRDEMQQFSGIPVETVENDSGDRDAAAVSTSAQTVENSQQETTVKQSVNRILTTESTADFVQTSAAAIETQTIPETETVPHNAETTAVVNAMDHEQTAEVNAVGDFDLDGAFTPADCAWAYLIRAASENGISVIEMLPITNEQREQCTLISFEELSRIDPFGDAQQRIEFDTEFYSDADAFDRDFPLSSIEYHSVMETGRLVFTYGLFPDLDVRTYLANQSYYNNILIENNETHEPVYRNSDDSPFEDVTWEQLLAELEDAKTWKGPIRFTTYPFQDREMREST